MTRDGIFKSGYIQELIKELEKQSKTICHERHKLRLKRNKINQQIYDLKNIENYTKDTVDIVDRLMDYTQCNDSDIDEAAKEITKLRNDIRILQESNKYLENDRDSWIESYKDLQKQVIRCINT